MWSNEEYLYAPPRETNNNEGNIESTIEASESQGITSVPASPTRIPSYEERDVNENVERERRKGKAPMEQVSTTQLQCRDKCRDPVVRSPTSRASNFRRLMDMLTESQRREHSHSTTPGSSSERKRVSDTEVVSSRWHRRPRVENTQTEVIVLEDDMPPTGEAALVESMDDMETFGGSESDREMALTMTPNCASACEIPSEPAQPRVVLETPEGLNLLTDCSKAAAQLFRSLIGPEEKSSLEEDELENLLTRLFSSILQSHQFVIAYEKKARDQMNELSSNVEHLKWTVGVLEAEVSELQSKNAGLEADNKMLKSKRASLVERYNEIKQEAEERKAAVSLLTTVNKELKGKISLKENERAHIYLKHNALQERAARQEADLVFAHRQRDKDKMVKARLQARIKALQGKNNGDRYVAKLERDWAVLNSRVDTLQEILDGDHPDIPSAILEAKAAANTAREALDQVLSSSEDDSPEREHSAGHSDDES